VERSTSWHSKWSSRLLLGAIVATAVVALGPGIVIAAGNKAIEVLRKATLARGEVTYSGEASVTTRFGDQTPRTLKQVVHYKQGGKEQIKLLDTDGQVIVRKVSDGHNQWEYFVTRGRLLRRPLPTPQERHERDLATLDILARSFAVSLEGEDTIAGRRAYRIRIARRDGDPIPVRKLWIDRTSFVELKSERYAEDGRVTYVTALDRINLAPELQSGIFRFQPPPNLRPRVAPAPRFCGALADAQEQAGFEAIPPSRVPRGFELLDRSVCVHEHDGHPVLLLRYTNGLDSFSMFQRRLPPDWKPPEKQPGRHRGAARTWVFRSFHFTLVGRLKPEHVEMIRDSHQ